MIEQFKIDVEKGLSSTPKAISSKYFYDQKGDALFVKIMHMPEYYPTRAEHEIFKTKTQDIIAALGLQQGKYFELIELGAGDGTKTKELLRELLKEGYDFSYLPVDISGNALMLLETALKEEMPSLRVKKQQGDYFEVLATLKETANPRVVLFLGSNIGNLSDTQAAWFLEQMATNMQPGDRLLLGTDLIKAASIVLPAYNDAQGITSDFNLNLLARINRELGANFNIENFRHVPEYTEEEGIARSYIESTADQTVTVEQLNKSFHFANGERMHTEISRKYNDTIINKIIADTSFTLTNKLTDSNNYFADYVLTRA